MNARRTLAVAGRIVQQLLRDRRAMALVLIAPLIVMSLLAVLLGTESPTPKVAIRSSGLIAVFLDDFRTMLEEPDDEDVRFEVVDLEESMAPDQAIRQGLVDAVIVFPSDFLEQRASGKRSRLDLFVEGADPMKTAEIFSRFRKAVPDAVGEFPKFMEVDCPLHCADTIPDSPPEMETIKVHGDEIEENMDFFIPVLPPFFVFFFVFLLSGLAFLRERGSGTAERLLASPLGKAELVTGYVLGFLPPALVQSTVVILFSLFVLGGPWGGWALVASVLLLCLVAECLGVFVSAFARTEFQVFQFIPLMILPQLLLSGIIWPVCDFPEWLKPVAYCLPLTYAVEAVRDAAIRGFGFDQLWQHLAALAGFVVLGIALASLSVRRTL